MTHDMCLLEMQRRPFCLGRRWWNLLYLLYLLYTLDSAPLGPAQLGSGQVISGTLVSVPA